MPTTSAGMTTERENTSWPPADLLPARRGVMAGLVPAIHVLLATKKDVDAHDERGHDDGEREHIMAARGLASGQERRHGRTCSGHPRLTCDEERRGCPRRARA